MFLRKLTAPREQRVTVKAFGGLDLRARCAPGWLAAMENMTSERYPTLSTRPKRAVAGQVEKPYGLSGGESLVWVDGTRLYLNGLAVGPVLSEGDKQLVMMGAYLVVFPDKVYVNTRQVADWGTLEQTVTAGEAVASLCDREGQVREYVTALPGEPEAGQLLLSEGSLMRFDGSLWVEEQGYTRLTAGGIGAGFAAGDGVMLNEALALVVKAEDDALVFSGLVCAMGAVQNVTVKRYVPEMDYVVECGNRLWGCKYGMVNGKFVNEVYASALGDLKNWNTFAGLSTDSYCASRGAGGPFTGAASYLGSPLFFREDCMERVYPAASGAHQIVTVTCEGVQAGSHKSLQVVEGVLYYLSRGGVQRFDGSMPGCVSETLGEKRFSAGVGGAAAGKYYLSCKDGGESVLLVYDTARKMWHREDDLQVLDFGTCRGELFALTESAILAMTGREGTEEEDFPWSAETGEWGLDAPEQTYLKRLDVRLSARNGALVTAAVSYDGGKDWVEAGSITGQGDIRPAVLRIRPRRCDHVRVKLSGVGDCTVYSVTAVYEKGSEEV